MGRKMGERALGWILALAVMAIALVALAPAALATTVSVTYRKATVDEATHSVTFADDSHACTKVTADDTTWGTSGEVTWYAVTENVTISGRVTVTGDVRLILCDGKTLQIEYVGDPSQPESEGGILVDGSNSLTIYAQSEDATTMGALTSNGVWCGAGIGGMEGSDGAAITINGGKVSATGGFGGAGIGASADGSEGVRVTINGGSVTAIGGDGGAGIGAGNMSICEEVTINGGTVKATGGDGGAGIGCGRSGACNTIVITGGRVTATGGSGAAGIGFGPNVVAGKLIVGLSKGDDYVLASSYKNGSGDYSAVSVADGHYLKDDGGHCYADWLNESILDTLGGKKLRMANPHTVSVDDGIAFGTATASPTLAEAGTEVTLTVEPEEGCRLEGLSYTPTGGTATAISGGKFDMPAKNVTVKADFAPDPQHFEKTGEDEYTIKTAAGWNAFCECLNDNATYGRFSGKTVKLGADISVTRMAGGEGHEFCGTFDGQEHTLTFHHGTVDGYKNDQFIAPFSHVSNVGTAPATIKNLHVGGDIYTSATYAAGLIGTCGETVSIENCRSSVAIHSSVSGGGNHGGFVARSQGTLSIEGCVFDGKLLTTGGTTSCGGFVGDGGTVAISDSLFAPAALGTGETEVKGDASATFSRNEPAIDNCHYTRELGTAQGKAARTVTAGEHVTDCDVALVGETTRYSVSGITAYRSGGFSYGGNLYYGKDDVVRLTLGHDDLEGYGFTGYKDSAGTLGGNDADGYTLTMPDGDVTISATLKANTYAVSFDKNAQDAAGTMDQQGFTYDEAAKALTANAYMRTGYDFTGWNTVATPTAENPGTAYADKQSVRNLTIQDNAELTLYAQWTQHDYSLAIAETSHGAVSAKVGEAEGATTAHYNDTVTLTVEPEAGYELTGLSYAVGGGEAQAIEKNGSGDYAFTMPAGDVTVSAMFSAWKWLQNEMAKNSTIKLERDYVCDDQALGPLVVPAGVTVTLDLNGHVIDRNLGEAKEDGSVIVVNGNLTVMDGKPDATHDPAITYDDPLTNQSVTVTGGVITGGNNAGQGGGVRVENGGSLALTGGTVSGNVAGSGGGVYNSGTFTMSGGSVSGNKNILRQANNVYLCEGTVITVTGALDEDTSIGVTMEAPGAFTSGDTDHNDAGKFFSDNASYAVGKNADGQLILGQAVRVTFDANGHGTAPEAQTVASGGLVAKPADPTADGYTFGGWYGDAACTTAWDFASGTVSAATTLYAKWTFEPVASVTSGETTTKYGAFADALAAWVDGSTLTLLADVHTTSTINVSGTMTLDLNGFGIANNGTCSVITVEKGGNLTLNDGDEQKNHRFTFKNNDGTGAGLATVDDSLESGYSVFSGGYITGGRGGYDENYSYGGGIWLRGGSVTMNAGNIIGNLAQREGGYGKGGAVAMLDGATFTMNGGSVMYNACYRGDQGAFHVSGSALYVNGGTIASNYCRGAEGDESVWHTGGIGGSNGTLYLSGEPLISGNIGEWGRGGTQTRQNAPNTVYVARDQIKEIRVTGPLTPPEPIGLSFMPDADEGPRVFTAGDDTEYNEAADFSCEIPGYAVGKNADGQLFLGQAVDVTFDANGHGRAPWAQTVASGSLVAKPADPTAGGYTFGGWYGEAACTTAWDFARDTVSAATTLYAKWTESVASVTVTPAGNMTLASGEATQYVPAGSAMNPVTYTAGDGYYFPTDYHVATSNGISVSRDSYTQISVSGTPTADATVTLLAPTAKVREDTPNATFEANGVDSGTLSGVAAGMRYSLDGGSTWKDISGTSVAIASGVTADDGIRVKMPGNGTTTTDSDVQAIGVTKAETPDLAVTQPATIGGKGSVASTAAHEYRPANGTGWTDCAEGQALATGSYLVRVRASGTVLASDAQSVTITAFSGTREDTPAATFAATGANGGTLSNVTSGMRYSLDGGSSWTDITATSVTIASGVTADDGIRVKMPGNGTTTTDSDVQIITVTRPTAPSAGKVDCSTTSNNDGKLTGVTEAMEYRKSDAARWTDGTGGDVTGLSSGTYYVRVKASGTALASANQELTIEAYVAPTYTVTYKVVNGTWSDDTTANKSETVQSGSKPARVPTGMKASEGFTGGAWDTNPADATITGATTFKYAFTEKQAATVAKAPTAKNLTYNGKAQALVEAGTAEGGAMVYALGENDTKAPADNLYATSIPTKTNAGT